MTYVFRLDHNQAQMLTHTLRGALQDLTKSIAEAEAEHGNTLRDALNIAKAHESKLAKLLQGIESSIAEQDQAQEVD